MKAGFKTLVSIVGGLAISGITTAGAAFAAETIVMTYGFVSMDIPIEDLEALAATGETSDELAQLLDMADQDPEGLRTALTEPLQVKPVALDLALNSPPGEWVLDRISETIQPASGVGGRLALRGALIGASADDNQITLLELMQVYPSPEIVVDGRRLLTVYSDLYAVIEPLADLVQALESVLDQ